MSFIPPHAEFPTSSLVPNFWWKFMRIGVSAPVSAFQYLLPTSQLDAANSPSPSPAQRWAPALSVPGQPRSSPTHPCPKISIF